MVKKAWTFTVIDDMAHTRTILGDTLAVSENGWVKVYLRKTLVGVVKGWRQVCLTALDAQDPAAGKE